MPACRTTVSMPESMRMSPTRVRDARCLDSATPSGCRPLRYTTRRTPAFFAAVTTLRADRSSSATKSFDVPIECTR